MVRPDWLIAPECGCVYYFSISLSIDQIIVSRVRRRLIGNVGTSDASDFRYEMRLSFFCVRRIADYVSAKCLFLYSFDPVKTWQHRILLQILLN